MPLLMLMTMKTRDCVAMVTASLAVVAIVVATVVVESLPTVAVVPFIPAVTVATRHETARRLATANSYIARQRSSTSHGMYT